LTSDLILLISFTNLPNTFFNTSFFVSSSFSSSHKVSIYQRSYIQIFIKASALFSLL
jgi:hypothetical protein